MRSRSLLQSDGIAKVRASWRAVRIFTLLAVGTGAWVQSAAAQSMPAAKKVGKLLAEHPEGFTVIAGIRELPDGRVFVSDSRERRVVVVDFAKGSVTSVGRVGNGPGEYGTPASLLAIGRDSTALSDPANGRLLYLRPDGTIAGETKLGDVLNAAAIAGRAGARGMSTPNVIAPLSADVRGKMYYLGRPFPNISAGGVSVPESTHVARIDPRTKVVDTLGKIGQHAMSMQVGGTAAAPTMRARGLSPLAPRDAWVAGADGAVAFVRTNPYRVDWLFPDGKRQVGQAYTVPPIRVTEEDKQRFVADMQRNSPIGSTPEAAQMLNQLIKQMEWPEFRSPFTGTPVMAADGRVWVPRTPARFGDPFVYDVFDRKGKIVERVEFPPSTLVLAITPKAIYTMRRDTDDVVYLQKYAR